MKLNKRLVFAFAGIICGSIIPFLLILLELEFPARAVLGILVFAIMWWIFKVVPEFVTALIMADLIIVVAKVPTNNVFSAFAGSTWWLLFAAFGLSIRVKKYGLIHRLSLHVLKLFPNTFRSQVLGLLVVGTITVPFISRLLYIDLRALKMRL